MNVVWRILEASAMVMALLLVWVGVCPALSHHVDGSFEPLINAASLKNLQIGLRKKRNCTLHVVFCLCN